MRERSVEIGGEILKVNDSVVVYNGRSTATVEIVKIGTKRIYLKVGGRETPFSLETRKDCENDFGYVPYFRTHTEVAQALRREGLLVRLRDLGVEPVGRNFLTNKLTSYPDEALEELISVLEKYQNSESHQPS